jgi:hypothetical protein
MKYTLSLAALLLTLPLVSAQETKILASDGAALNRFGWGVSLDAGIAMVGAFGASSAYLFDADPASPAYAVELSELVPAPPGGNFGQTISQADGLALIGAPYNQNNMGSGYIGAAFLFDVDPASPNFGQQLIGVSASSPVEYDAFAHDVSLDGGLGLIGAIWDRTPPFNEITGSAYVFDMDPASPTFGAELIMLKASDGSRNAAFGCSVSLENKLALVGAYSDGAFHGAVYLYDVDPSSPTFGNELIKLTASDSAGTDWFGFCMDVEDGIAVIGAVNKANNRGAAYVFDVDPASATFGTELAKLLASDGSGGDNFGYSVSLDNGKAWIGAAGDNPTGSDSGSCYTFDVDPASPTFGQEDLKIIASDGATDDQFGFRVAFDGGVALVGAIKDDDNGSDSGSAYLFAEVSNDDCVYATPIAGDGVFPVDNTDGTGLDADPGCAAFGSDVWYRWTAAATGTVTMDMCDGAATYDSALAAWEDAVGCPSTLIVCNDDTCVLQSEVTFACTTGTVYMIQVGGFNGASGTGNLNVATDPPCIDGTYCTSLPNSTGATAAITWTGSCVVADNNFTLVVRSCPISQPGLFIYGANQASIPFGNGVLCLGQPILRLNPPVFVDSTGLASKGVDLANPPSASGTITAGSTWNFQMWLRDPNAGGAAYNFTDGMSVTFQ